MSLGVDLEIKLDSQLSSAAKLLGLAISDSQKQQLLLLLQQLLKWNKTYNLTAIKDPQQALTHHILDSLSVIPFLQQQIIESKHPQSKSLIDVGTGAGFPGLPIAIMCPELMVSLLDSNSKKIRFIRQVTHQLQLQQVKVIHSRVENHSKHQYNWVISRAFASTADMIKLTQHLLAEQGSWLAMKAQDEQMDDLNASKVVNCHVHPLQVPSLDAKRCLLELSPIKTSA